MSTYLVENQHDAGSCDDAFDALERAVTESDAGVRDDTLLCTCPHGSQGGTLIVEAEDTEEVESFAHSWDVGETTVHQIREMEVG